MWNLKDLLIISWGISLTAHYPMKNLFNWTSFFGTLFIFVFLWGISKIGVQFEFLNVFEQVFENFSLSDYYYKVRGDDNKYDDRIVIVNISDYPRWKIAQQISQLNNAGAKVIAIDAFFRKDLNEPEADTMLSMAIAETENFVLVSGLLNLDSATNRWDTLSQSFDFISKSCLFRFCKYHY